MIQDDREYDRHIKVLQNLLKREDALDYKKIDREIDNIIALKKSFTNDLRLESNRVNRERYALKLANHDEAVRGILTTAPEALQTSDRAKVLSDLIERSNLYSHVEGKGNSELISSAQGNVTPNTLPGYKQKVHICDC